MATRFRKQQTRRQKKSKALRTRKHRGGNGLFERLGLKKASPFKGPGPASMPTSNGNNMTMMNLGSIGVKHSDLLKKEKITQHAKKIREYVARFRNANQSVKQEALALLNKQGLQKEKEKLVQMAEYPGWNSLSDKEVLEVYIFGKPRSSSV